MGGLGIKNLNRQNEALGAKLTWRLFKEKDQKWAKILYNKYLNADDPFSIFRMKSLPKESDSWNFIEKSRSFITKYLTWDVGNGEEVLFWEDSLDGHPLIDNLGFPQSSKELLINLWGPKVSDYKIKIYKGNLVEWKWKSIKEIEDDPDIIKIYENMVLFRNIKQGNKEDKLVWAASNDGKYSAKMGYKSLINYEKWEKVDIPLKLSWDTACLPKASFFLWLAYQKRILTQDRL